ncbi:MAG: hypothetical protein M0033_10090 [Nitrospiraceae bacterium]|nr:hypothetical protein [Nitrospiraceae bacterium]
MEVLYRFRFKFLRVFSVFLFMLLSYQVIGLLPDSVNGGVAFANGTFSLTGVTIDTTPVFSMATIVITAIAAIWAIKKVIKLGNRS